MSTVVGGKVRNPPIRTGRPLQNRSRETTELAKAWSAFGKSQAALSQLEDRAALQPARSNWTTLPSANSHTPGHSRVVTTTYLDSAPSRPAHPSLDPPSGCRKPTLDTAVRKPCSGDAMKNGRVLNEHLPSAITSTATGSTSHMTSSSRDMIATFAQPGLGVDTGKIMASVYGGSGPSAHTQSSPSRPNPRALFGPVNFKQGGVAGTSRVEENSHVEPVGHGAKTKPVTRKTYSGSTTVTSSSGVLVASSLCLHNATVSHLKAAVDKQRKDIPCSKAKLDYLKDGATAKGHDLRTANPVCPPQNAHVQNSTSTMTRKVSSAPPPQAYTGFSSVISQGGMPQSCLKGEKKTSSISMGSSRATGVRQPDTRSSNYSSHTSHLGTGARPASSFKSKSDITPSSWRAGKELADRVLGREKKPSPTSFQSTNLTKFAHLEAQKHSPPLSHTSLNLSPSLSVHVPTMRTGLFAKETNENAAGMLVDLELSSEGELEEQNGTDDMDQPSLASQMRRALREKTPESELHRKRSPTYDREAVKQYMRDKQEERKRKLRQEKIALQARSLERRKRLLELRDRQQRILAANISQRQKLDKVPDYFAQSYAVTARHDCPLSSSYGREALFVSPHVPSSQQEFLPHPPGTMKTSFLPSSLPPSRGMTSVGHSSCHTSVSFSHVSGNPEVISPHLQQHPTLSPSPHPSMVISDSIYTTTGPPHLYNSTHPTCSTTRVEPVPASSSTSSSYQMKLTFSSPQTSSLDPSSSYLHHSSPRHSSPHRLSPHHTSPHRHHSLSLQSQCPICTSVQPSPTQSNNITPVPPRHPSSSVHQYDKRLLELKHSALLLKEKIAAERRLLEIQGLETSYRGHTSGHWRSPPSVVVEDSGALPGVNRLDQHAVHAERLQKHDEAATTIQTAWRGHVTRKTIRHELPAAPVTLATTTCIPHIGVSTTCSPALSSSALSFIPTPVSASSVSVPPWTSQQQPWTKVGGDSLSVINIFTSQQRKPHSPPPPTQQGTVPQVLGPTLPANAANTQLSYTDTFEDDHSGSSISEEEAMATNQEEDSASDHTPATPTQLTDAGVSSATVLENVHAITPPGSTSFHETFSASSVQQQQELNAATSHPPTTAQSDPARYSPRSLELQLRAGLSVLETLEEGMRQVDNVSSTRAVALAQQETVALAQLMKSQDKQHQEQVSRVGEQAGQNMAVVRKQLEQTHEEVLLTQQQMKEMQLKSLSQSEEHARQLQQLQEDACQRARETSQRLTEVQSQAAATAVLQASQQQMQAAQSLAVNVATAATEKAVQTALQTLRPQEPTSREVTATLVTPTGHTTVNYKSDFETYTTTFEPDSLNSSHVHPTGAASLVPPKVHELSPQLSGGSHTSHTSGSITPVPTEVSMDEDQEEGDGSFTLNEDVDHDLPKQLQNKELENKKTHKEFSLSVSSKETEPSLSVCSDVDSTPGASGEASPYPGVDDSFEFISQMVHQYVKEEETRARHQGALLQLREKALKEKTKAQLDWLRMKRMQGEKKGTAEQMPPLSMKEKVLIKRMKEEQAEIHRLREAQREASQQRKLMLMQQRDIAHMRRSTQYYREKMRQYGSREQLFSPSPSPSLDGSQQDLLELMSSASKTLPLKELPPSPGVDIPEELSNLSCVPSLHSDLQAELPSDKATSSQWAAPNDIAITQQIHDLSVEDEERRLMKRKKRLAMQKKAAEDALRCQKELLKKEAELQLEEQRIKEILTEALSCQQIRLDTTRHAPVSSHTFTTPLHPLIPPTASESVIHEKEFPSSQFHATTTSTPLSSSKVLSSTVPEEVEDVATSSDTVEELLTVTSRRSVPTASVSHLVTSSSRRQYATDTFESDGSLGTTLTQLQDLPGSLEKDSEADSVSVTSEGSELELRVRHLQEMVLRRERELKRQELEQQRKKKAALRNREKLLQSQLKAMEEKEHEHSLLLFPSKDPTPMTEPSSTTLPHPLSSHQDPETALPVPIDFLPPGEEGKSSPISTSSSSPSTVISAIDHAKASLTHSREVSPASSAATWPDQELTAIHSEVEEEMLEEESAKGEFSSGEEEHEVKTGEVPSAESPCPTPPTRESGSPTRSPCPMSVQEDLSSSHKSSLAETPLSSIDHPAPTEENVTPSLPCSSSPKSPSQLSAPLDKTASPSYSSGFEPSPSPSSSLPSVPSHSQRQGLSTVSSTPSREVATAVDHPAQVVVGCYVLIGNTVRGVVRFIGETEFAKGLWIGVELDSPCGKNDGSIQGKRYFSCAPNYGVFAPPSKVQVLDQTSFSESVGEASVSSAAEEELESTEEQVSSDHALASLLAAPNTESVAEQLNAKKEHLQHVKEQDSFLSTILESGKDTVSSFTPPVALPSLEPRGEAPSSEHSVISSLSDEVPEQLSEEEAAAEDASQQTVSPCDAHMPSDDQAATEPSPALHVIQVEKDHELQVDNVTQQLARQLTSEAFSTIHGIWRSKQQDHLLDKEIDLQHKEGKTNLASKNKEEHAERITEQLMAILIESEVDLLCNIRNARKDLSSLPAIAETEAHVPPSMDTSPVPAAAPDTVLIQKQAQAMGEPLAMVPSRRKAVDEITACAWNLVKNSAPGTENPLPPVELVKKLCCSPFPDTRHCEESVLLLIFELAIETMRSESCQHSSSVGRLAATCCPQVMTLEQLQESVYSQLHGGRLPVQLPMVKYLHGNTRPGGKEVDFVDSILIRELRNEEPSWVDYEEDEKLIKTRIANTILDTLLSETVDILNHIHQKRKERLRTR